MKVDSNDFLSVADYNVIMRTKGYFVGYYGSSTSDNLVDEISKKLGENLQNAKGVSVTFYYADTFSTDRFRQIMDKIDSLLNKEANLVFSSEVDNGISTDILDYEILLSGLSEVTK